RWTSGRRTTTSARGCPRQTRGAPGGPGPWACCWWRWAGPSAPATSACRLGAERRGGARAVRGSAGRERLDRRGDVPRAGVAARDVGEAVAHPVADADHAFQHPGEPVDVGAAGHELEPVPE